MEARQSQRWHEFLRHLHGDPTADAIRYEPDLLAWKLTVSKPLRIEVKTRKPDSPNIAFEIPCHENAMRLRRQGEFVAYWLPGWRMVWPEDIEACILFRVDNPIRLARAKQNGGSGTPFFVVRNCDITTDWKTFIRELECQNPR